MKVVKKGKEMKNWIITLIIFILPMVLYGYMDAKAQSDLLHRVASQNIANPIGKIIEFSSPMCSECQEIAPEIEKAMKNYKNSVILEKINVLEDGKYSKSAIKEFKVTLVPTTIFINKDGKVLKKVQGLMKSDEIIEQIERMK